MSRGITVLELRGFAAISTSLARDMDRVALTPERVRAGAVRMVDAIIEDCRARVPIVRAVHIGGDSWFIESASVEDAVHLGIRLLKVFESKCTQGLYYLKPSLATGCGEPKLYKGKFIDDASIATYRAADTGRPFRYTLVGDAEGSVQQHDWIILSSEELDDQTVPVVDWRASVLPHEPEVVPPDVTLPKLLLDSEVLYSSSAAEAVSTIQQHQASARNVYAFGGPVPLDVPVYRAYVKMSIALVQDEGGPTFTVLSYIPMNEPEASFAWLELCRRLSIQYHTRYSFRAFPISEGQLRPFSFQIFDDDSVHLGLRSYSAHRGTPTMSSAVMFRNTAIAARFKGEFIENWRSLDGFGSSAFAELQRDLDGMSATARQAAMRDVEELLRDMRG